MQELWVQSLGQEDPLEKEMATHSSILGQRLMGYTVIGSQRVRHKSTSETVLPLDSYGELPIFIFLYLKKIFFTCILLYLCLTALHLASLGFFFLVVSGVYSQVVFHGLLIVATSVVAEHGP